MAGSLSSRVCNEVRHSLYSVHGKDMYQLVRIDHKPDVRCHAVMAFGQIEAAGYSSCRYGQAAQVPGRALSARAKKVGAASLTFLFPVFLLDLAGLFAD